ncbi:citryl-CoA lyase [Nonomuraea lactucae]|uniref:citryl-CoA lyase n=1 Tax=Nonomuraea lactucae TaxID=2249762 RepID=UPI000DE2DA8C|nr:citryl-CoA lyase [Nonomuraea lactucae]
MSVESGRIGIGDVTAWWANGIARIAPGEIALRGYPIERLIGEVGFGEMIWLMLRGELPGPQEARLLEAALVSAVDHGPQAPSIAAARMAATCGVGLNSAVATGVNLLGDVHGGAGQQCMEVLAGIRAREAGGEPLGDAVADVVADVRSRMRYVPGFGHRFHPRDPRRDPLLELVREAVAGGLVSGDHLRAALELEEQIAPVPMNVDGATAVVYSELGFEPPLGRGLFVLSRSVGILAHAWEEQSSGGRLKGPMPRRLLADYHGPAPRDLPDLA